jgi:hypothetical protein
MHRARRIVEVRIDHWLKIAAFGSDGPRQCHRAGLTQTERFEALHRAGQLLDEAMILLNHVVEIFDLQDFDQPEPPWQQQQAVDVLQACDVRAALVDDNLFGPPIVLDRAGEEGARRSRAPVLGGRAINGFPGFIDGTTEIDPLAFDLNMVPAIRQERLVRFAALGLTEAIKGETGLSSNGTENISLKPLITCVVRHHP